MKGIVLAGGRGSRLYPLTLGVSKQLLPVYNKPMIYYPLSVLMLAGIRDILLITAEEDLPAFRRLLGDGSRFGIRLVYAVQPQPRGVADALLIGEDFIGGGSVCLILGDNIFYGQSFGAVLRQTAARQTGASVFAIRVQNPARFGIVSFDAAGRPESIVEKPVRPLSDWAVCGLYFYDSRAPALAKTLSPSARGELEISDLNRLYLEEGSLYVEKLGRGLTWMDAGTCDALFEASAFVRSVESVQHFQVACLEEIAFHYGWLTRGDLSAAAACSPPEQAAYLRWLVHNARPLFGVAESCSEIA